MMTSPRRQAREPPVRGTMSGQRYLADTLRRDVHDLDRETGECRIDEIIYSSRAKPYPTLVLAHGDGYQDCTRCMSR